MNEVIFDENESVVNDIVSQIESEGPNSISYDKFADKLIEKLQDKESQKTTKRIYELFIEDTKGTLIFEVFKKFAVETWENASDEALRRLIKNGPSNGIEILMKNFILLWQSSNDKKK